MLYVIREEGSADPVTIGGHEMSQFSAKSVKLVDVLRLHDREVSIFALYK